MAQAHNLITRCIFYALLGGFLIWAGSLMNASFAVRDLRPNTPYTVRVATFNLHTIQKVPIHDGYRVQISLESGIIWYGLHWLGLGVASGLFMKTLRTRQRT